MQKQIPLKDRIAQEQEDVLRLFQRFYPEPKQNPRVLNLFCGMALDEPVIYEHFGKDSEIFSIDHNQESEKLAQEHGFHSFVRGDIKQLEEIIRGEFDLVLMRNPPFVDDETQYEFRKQYWLFQTLPKYMAKGADLFVTLLNCHEYRITPRVINASGYSWTKTHINCSRPVRGAKIPGFSASQKDHYVITAKKPVWWSKLLSWGMEPYAPHTAACGYE